MILGFTVLISLLALFRDETIFDKLILHPFGMFRNGEYYRLISHSFLHADIWHLLFNMYSFYSFAPILENYFGPTKFLVLYFGAVLVSVYSTVTKHRFNPAYRCLGASGGVSGVVFAFIVLKPTSQIGIMFIPIPAPAYIFGLVYLAYSYFSSTNDDQINHEAHFYGAMFGILLTFLFFPDSLGNFLNQIRS
jgi:membrane associated rhomboid family serine protease